MPLLLASPPRSSVVILLTRCYKVFQSSTRKDFNYLRSPSIEKHYQMKICFYKFPQTHSARQGVTVLLFSTCSFRSLRKITTTQTEMSFWRYFRHWLHQTLSFGQLWLLPVTKIMSKWRRFRLSDYASSFRRDSWHGIETGNWEFQRLFMVLLCCSQQ